MAPSDPEGVSKPKKWCIKIGCWISKHASLITRILFVLFGFGSLYFSPVEVIGPVRATFPIVLGLFFIISGLMGLEILKLEFLIATPQNIIRLFLLILGFVFIVLSVFKFTGVDDGVSSTSVFWGGMLLLILGVLDPETIQKIMLPGGAGLERYQSPEAEKRTNAIIEKERELTWEQITKDENFVDLHEAAQKRTDEQRSAGDYYILATKAQRIKDYDEALKFVHCGLILEQEKTRVKAALTNRKGTIYYYLKLFDMAKKCYLEAISLNPNDPYPYNNRGNAYFKQKKYNEAKSDYNKAIQLRPCSALAHYNLGRVYLEQSDLIEAEKELKEAIWLGLSSPLRHNGLGRLYFKQEKYNEAEQELKKAIRLDEEDADPHNNLGDLYIEQHRYTEASSEFEKALELDPNNDLALEGLEKVRRSMGPV